LDEEVEDGVEFTVFHSEDRTVTAKFKVGETVIVTYKSGVSSVKYVAGYNVTEGNQNHLNDGQLVVNDRGGFHGHWVQVWRGLRQVVEPKIKPVTDDEVKELFGLA